MFPMKHLLIAALVVLLSVPTLQEDHRYNWTNPNWNRNTTVPLKDLEGKFTMTTDRKELLLKDVAEYLDTTPDDVEAIRNSPTVGNYQFKLISIYNPQKIQITMETLKGQITDRLEVGGISELAWFDGRKFSVTKMSRFANGMGIVKMTMLSLRNMGKDGMGLTLYFGRNITEWLYNIPKQRKRISIRYKRAE